MKKTEKDRIPKDQYFLKIAGVVALCGTCPRKKIGAVLVHDGMIVSTGYNGAPRGIDHCDGKVGCRMIEGHCVRTVHAEVNAVVQAAYNGVATSGATLYTQYLPCEHCAKVLINAGVKRIVYSGIYENADNEYTKENLTKAGVKFELLQ
ncbi:MAG: hypothetical protein A2782_00355 [Candidatus Blackburnbacteria bacterium RIFCSPHIGHO2_01_FULL_43_15b]|uniref:CMP/dCMP-type deaminase domain-containing protein n=1 Tax=Candidatus Blackburnbacteria bacterium RIFCSPHIGHO2_01_FULL_43_15b TaxID=1797513 RepID=A0A1G1UYN9_9BACT|nr:MAG: hypothetical protein A2782_00355 [Candidatus Blackburnbacteria bacterium RIFCSPHIGHO2_01_FULL_43_15b]